MAFYQELDYYNTFILKRVCTPQTVDQCSKSSAVVDGGTGAGCGTGVWPINNAYAPPQTVNITDGSLTGYSAASTSIPFQQSVVQENFYLEESRIKGGFNDVETGYGARAYLDEEDPIQQIRSSALIYSGIFNSRTGINRTNEFPSGESITKSANPEFGSIQKIYAEETNLIVLQENKCGRALIDKDTIYTAEGGTQTQSGKTVIGQITPYHGEYGISKNPESFAIYAFRKYFIDRNRNAALRLSHDGITEISEYGMRDWFRDNLAPMNDLYTNTYTVEFSTTTTDNTSIIIASTTPIADKNLLLGSELYVDTGSGYAPASTTNPILVTQISGENIYLSRKFDFSSITSVRIQFVSKKKSLAIGGYDIYNKQYICSLQYNTTAVSPASPNNTYYTVGFDEQINGWPSFYSFRPGIMGSLKNNFYTATNFYNDYGYSDPNVLFGIYKHYSTVANTHGKFYGISYPATVTVISNDNPSIQKNFLTIDYEGGSGWKVTEIQSDPTGFDKEYAGGVPLATWKEFNDDTNIIYSYYEGQYDGAGNTGATASPANPPLLRAGFDRKENRYVANLVNNTPAMPGEISFGANMSGIKGFYNSITMSTDTTTNPGGMKELYAVGMTYNISSR
jgi:hypothetical protein